MAKKESKQLRAGQVLIAQPFMGDGYFKRTVVGLCEHRPDGSVGFILNKTVGMNICDLIADFPEFESEVGFGGPVATDTIHYLHNVGDILDGSTEIVRGGYWGGDFDKLKFLVRSKLIEPKNIRFFVGYSGWDEGQLQGELAENSWVVDEMYANYVFKAQKNKLWETVLTNKGDVYTVIAQMNELPSLN